MSRPTLDRRSVFKFACVIMAACALPAPAAQADTDFPQRAITLVVPFAAGGGTDVVARLVAKKMGEELGQSIVVENRPGAGGSIGSGWVARAAPDGYTIIMGTASTHAINASLYKSLPYDPQDAFAPITLLATVPEVIVVSGKAPYRTLAELITAMRERPGGLTYGSQGMGGIAHLVGEMVDREARVETVHVPYKGAAPAVQDLIAGNIDIIYDTLPILLPHIQSGALRALAVADVKPLPQLPDVPTTAAAGMPELQASTWNALYAPAGTPRPVIDRLNQAALTALQDRELVDRLIAMSAQPVGSTPDELETFTRAETAKWADIIKAADIKLD